MNCARTLFQNTSPAATPPGASEPACVPPHAGSLRSAADPPNAKTGKIPPRHRCRHQSASCANCSSPCRIRAMADIFISYASQDREIARQLAERLGEASTPSAGIAPFRRDAYSMKSSRKRSPLPARSRGRDIAISTSGDCSVRSTDLGPSVPGLLDFRLDTLADHRSRALVYGSVGAVELPGRHHIRSGECRRKPRHGYVAPILPCSQEMGNLRWLILASVVVQVGILPAPKNLRFVNGNGSCPSGEIGTPPSCFPAPPASAASGKRWRLAYSEEFSGAALDLTKLSPCFDWNFGGVRRRSTPARNATCHRRCK